MAGLRKDAPYPGGPTIRAPIKPDELEKGMGKYKDFKPGLPNAPDTLLTPKKRKEGL